MPQADGQEIVAPKSLILPTDKNVKPADCLSGMMFISGSAFYGVISGQTFQFTTVPA